MWQQRFWGKRRSFKTPAKRPLKIALSARGIYEPVKLEKDVVGEIVALLWYNGVPVYQERERVPQCGQCGSFVSKPSDAGHPDLHGWIPARKLLPVGGEEGACLLSAVPFYIECKRPQGGVESYVQQKFIEDAKRHGVLALFARSWGDVKNAFASLGVALHDGEALRQDVGNAKAARS